MKENDLKKCTLCGEVFHHSYFHKESLVCNGCESAIQRVIRIKKMSNFNFKEADVKMCSSCGIQKNVSEFHKDNTKTDGRRSHCKECTKKYVRKRYPTQSDAGSLLNDGNFTFHKFDKSSSQHTPSIGIQLSIYCKSGHKSILFNTYISQIISRKGVVRLMIREDNSTGELHIVLNRNEGAPLKKQANSRFRVYNSAVVGFLLNKLNLSEGTNYSIDISDDLSRSNDYCTLKILNK